MKNTRGLRNADNFRDLSIGAAGRHADRNRSAVQTARLHRAEVVNRLQDADLQLLLPITLFYSLATVELSMQMLLILLVSLVMNTTRLRAGLFIEKAVPHPKSLFSLLSVGRL